MFAGVEWALDGLEDNDAFHELGVVANMTEVMGGDMLGCQIHDADSVVETDKSGLILLSVSVSHDLNVIDDCAPRKIMKGVMRRVISEGE